MLEETISPFEIQIPFMRRQSVAVAILHMYPTVSSLLIRYSTVKSVGFNWLGNYAGFEFQPRNVYFFFHRHSLTGIFLHGIALFNSLCTQVS